MATRFYIPSASGTSGLTPTADAGWNYTSEKTVRDLIRAKYASPSAIALGVRIGPWSNTAGQTALDSQLISPPLAAQTISGTISVMAMVKEFATTDNVDRFHIAVKIINSSGTVQSTLLARGAATGSSTTEVGTTATTTTFANAANLTSQTCSAGDRILVEIGYSNSTAATTPEASINFGENATDATLGDNATTANRAAWVEFSANLTFQAPTVTSLSSTSGASGGGTSVTITGTNFYNGSTTVAFGSNNATSVVVTSTTTLTCTVPAGTPSTTVNVTVTNGDGTSGTKTNAYSYNAQSAMELVFSNAGGAQVYLFANQYSTPSGIWKDDIGIAPNLIVNSLQQRPTGVTNLASGGNVLVQFDGATTYMWGSGVPSASMPTWSNGRTFVEHFVMRRKSPVDDVTSQRLIDYNSNDYWILNVINAGEMYRVGARSDSNLLGATFYIMSIEHNVQSGISSMVVNGSVQAIKGSNATGTRTQFINNRWVGSRDNATELFPGHLGCYGLGWATGWSSTNRAALYTAISGWLNGTPTAAGGGTVYRLTATPTQFAFTGNVAGLTVSRFLTAARQTMGFSGNVATLMHGYPALTASRATLGFSGNTATLLAARTLTAQRQTMGATMRPATLIGAHTIAAARQTMGVSGNVATLMYGRAVVAQRQTMGFSASVATLLSQHLLSATKQTIVFSGAVATLAGGHVLPAVKQTVGFTGNPATLIGAHTIAAQKQTMIFTGLPVTLLKGVSLAAQKQTMIFTGLPVNLTAARSLTAQKQTMLFTGLPAALNHGYYLAAAKATAIFTGIAANLARGVRLTAQKQTMLFTGLAANLAHGYYVSAARATIGFTGLDVAFSTSSGNRTLTAARQTIVFTGMPANLASAHLVTASRATLGFTGYDAALRVTMPATNAAITVTDRTTNLTVARTLPAANASIAFTGQTTLLERQLRLTAANASIAFTGRTTTFARGYYMTAGNAAITFTGRTTLLERQLRLTATQIAIAVTANTAALLYSANFHTLQVSSAAFAFVGYDVALAHIRPHTVRIVWGQKPALRVDFLEKPAAKIAFSQKPAAKIVFSQSPAARIEWRQDMSSSLNVNDTNRIDFTFYDTDDEDTPVDPSTLVAEVVSPSGVRTTYTYGTDSQWQRLETGRYRLSILCTEAKGWGWTVTVTGNVAGAESGSFTVNRNA